MSKQYVVVIDTGIDDPLVVLARGETPEEALNDVLAPGGWSTADPLFIAALPRIGAGDSRSHIGTRLRTVKKIPTPTYQIEGAVI